MSNKTLYTVKPEWCYGDDGVEKRAKQLSILSDLGLTENESRGKTICDAETAIELMHRGYCAKYDDDKVQKLMTVENEDRVSELMDKIVDKLLNASPQSFNNRVQAQQPGDFLTSVTETMLLEDCCTDNLQSHISRGWRIIAVQPQPDQRRPDYILGRAFSIPEQAERG